MKAMQGMFRAAVAALCVSGIPCVQASAADVLYSQAPSGSGTLITSAYWDPDGSDYDEYMWDGFTLTHAGDITEIRWRGAGGLINDFELSICPSIPVGTQPDVIAQPLWHKFTGNNAGQTYVGTFGGVALYDYHYALPKSFHVAAGVPLWIRIVAWQPGWPTWGVGTGSGGNGSHFHRSLAVTGDFRFYFAGGDAAFTLLGNHSSCSSPGIGIQPQPVTGCAGSTTAVFTTSATGAGPFTYQWRQNGYPVNNGANGGGHGGGAYITGANTATLTIQNASYWADVGTYDCVILNDCGPAITQGADLSISFGGPSIQSGPASASVCTGGSFSLTTSATNGPLTYGWKRNGTTLTNGPTAWGSNISGATTATLSVASASTGDAGMYTCTVTNACMSATTAPAEIVLCPADFDCSGFVDLEDFTAFVLAFDAGTNDADFDQSGFVDTDDYDAFVHAFEAGC